MGRRVAFVSLLLGLASVFALAQAQQGERRRNRDGANGGAARESENGGNQQGRRGGGFGGDPAQMRERMLAGVKELMGATDDEWKAIQPKVEKVSTLQRELRPGMAAYGMRRGGGGGGGDAGQAESTTGKAQLALRTALQDKSASADDIAKKLAALREAKEKAKADLQAAQKDLKSSVNPRQEAALVVTGLLD